MAEVSYRELSLNGLWKNNPAIVQLLGLCPLLAVSTTAVTALGLGLVTLAVLIASTVALGGKSASLSSFPSLLLLSTVVRLTLNVSSTRLILSSGKGGEVIGVIGRSELIIVEFGEDEPVDC